MGREIVFLLPHLGGGGAERVAVTLAQEFDARGDSVRMVLMRAWGPYLSRVPAGVPVVDLGIGWRIRAVGAFARYLRETRPAAVLSFMSSTNCIAWAARRLSGVPARIVMSEHSVLSEGVRRKPYRRPLLPVMRRAYPEADAVVAVSAGVADDLSRRIGLSRERITVIYNAVIGPHVSAGAAEPAGHPWLDAPDRPVVLSVGRLVAQKNHASLVEAFARLRRERAARLVILGEGSEKPKLEAMVARLGLRADALMPGFVANPYAWMARASVFVLSSELEGLPTVLVEALACGVPVVSTDCPSGPREILRDGAWGRLVAMRDPVAMAEAIAETLDAPRPAPPDLSEFTKEATYRRYRPLLLPEG